MSELLSSFHRHRVRRVLSVMTTACLSMAPNVPRTSTARWACPS
ncbi:hypothetical protein UMZ34_07150 [Halopseudomonas pachastrellae]|nr:hypothetical protein UMZ34_07150 [Halopseudomonas pachastrellae]